MSLYNAMFETTAKLKKAALEGSKATRDATRKMAIAAQQSETVKSAGPALGKMARYAAYPVGLGGGIGIGSWAAGAGVSSAIGGTGAAMKKGWTPQNIKDAGMQFFGVLLFIVFAGLAVYVYRLVKGG